MLDLHRLRRIVLSSQPRAQKWLANAVLTPNYRLLPGVEIVFENADRLPKQPVIFAMNHTDRYNYWPFQYRLWKKLGRFTATWVKGKYYENAAIGYFMEHTNNIPTVSRGYLISKDFIVAVGRRPSNDEYRALRDWVEGNAEAPAARIVPNEVLKKPRNPLGRAFEPSQERYDEYINGLFAEMMRLFVGLNAQAFERGLDVLIFPQGTRSIRLSQGHPGLAQIALRFGRTVVPVGCSGSDKLYPGGNPFAKAGRVVYRFGEPLGTAELAEFAISEDFDPFTAEAQERHGETFQKMVDLIMERIDGLVDEPYRFADGDGGSDERERGARRFL